MLRRKNLAALTRTLLVALVALTVTSCKTPSNVVYFSGLANESRTDMIAAKEVVVRPGDKVLIMVSSKDPQLAALFNLRAMNSTVGVSSSALSSSSGGSNQMASYTVDPYGDIQFPVLGTLHISGMRRSELAEFIQKRLIDGNLIKDPVVIVEFMNHGVNVLGEVSSPKRVDFNRDNFTVLDAIAEAGDLTIQGERTNVLVLRKEGGREVAYRIDLTDAQQTFNSPAYYLEPNDIIYVEPTATKMRQRSANGSSVLTPGFWISLVSMALTIAVLVVK